MQEHVTFLRTEARSHDGRWIASALPPDLFEQARGRVRLLAGFFILGFGFDLVLFLGTWAFGSITPEPSSVQWLNLGAVLTSAGLWWASRDRRVSAPRLHTLSLAYEVVICFIMATVAYWQFYIHNGILANLTWVPAVVIMFPLVMPGPPRRMLGAALASAAMAPLSLLLLDLSGTVPVTDGEAYVQAAFGSFLAVGFAYLGARVVYGLGREVVAARELGSYRLEEKLGQGGMGEVWRGHHRMLARAAAIKIIRPILTRDAQPAVQEEARRRFEREAQAIAQLRSPHTVDLFDFGVATDGAFYYAMELLDGFDLDTLVRRFGPVPAERAIYLLRQICHSLSEAEACGLVHRDIKPANIFICRYGEDYDFVKVLDFGLVTALKESVETSPGLTGENAIKGTPAFIAPEQALGHAALDGRVDIYATGCVAYWLLTGQLVFTAQTPMELIMHHVRMQPAAPSTRTELSIPTALDDIVLSCLAKEPAERPQSARELSRRLAEVEVASAWTEGHARDWWAHPENARSTPVV